MQYIEATALQTSHKLPALPFTIKAVFGEFRNRNRIWVQLWRETNASFRYELMWQVQVYASVGHGNGEWVSDVTTLLLSGMAVRMGN